LPRTPLWELTALPQKPLAGFGGRFAAGRGTGGLEREWKGKRKMEGGYSKGGEAP